MIRVLLIAYMVVLLIDFIFSFIPDLRNTKSGSFIHEWSSYICDPIRQKMPPEDYPVDFSPLIAITLLFLVRVLW